MATPKKSPGHLYICSVVSYYDPEQDRDEAVRVTGAVVNATTKQLIDYIECWLDETDDEAVTGEIRDLADEWELDVCFIQRAMPLVPCPQLGYQVVALDNLPTDASWYLAGAAGPEPN